MEEIYDDWIIEINQLSVQVQCLPQVSGFESTVGVIPAFLCCERTSRENTTNVFFIDPRGEILCLTEVTNDAQPQDTIHSLNAIYSLAQGHSCTQRLCQSTGSASANACVS